jgi:DnaA family protein
MGRAVQLSLDLGQPPPPRLGNFVVGRNAEVLASLAHASEAGAHERIVYLWGGEGVGKSHLLAALAHHLREAGASCQHVEAARLSWPAPASDGYCLDDMDGLRGEAWVSVFNLYNQARESGRAFVAAGRSPPLQLDLPADLRSRLAWGLVFEVQPLSDAEKRDVLRRHGHARGMELGDAVLDYLMTHWRRDLGSLIAVVESMDRYSLATRRAITLPLLRELLVAR